MKNKFGDAYDRSKIRNRLRTLKGHYYHIKTLVELSGFGWDDITKSVTANEEVWNDFIKVSALVIYSNVILSILFLISSLPIFVSYVDFRRTQNMNFIDIEILSTFKSSVLYLGDSIADGRDVPLTIQRPPHPMDAPKQTTLM